MRIIGTIEHPQLKISIFKMNERISVKFENARYEQTFKMGSDERFQTPEAIERWVDGALLEQVMLNFRSMHAAAVAATRRTFPEPDALLFDEII